MSKDVILNAGTTVEHETVVGGVSTWAVIPSLLGFGAVGEHSDPKEKTTLSDTNKKYDSGMRDAPDKNLKGQYIPFQEIDDEHYDKYVLQQAFILRCRNEEEFNVRINWSDKQAGVIVEVNGYLFKSLGFEFDDGNQEEWRMFTVNGKQNSRTVFGVSIDGTLTAATAADSQLTIVTEPIGIDTSLGTIYWSSDDEAIATVVDGLVTGVASGTCNITAEFRGVTATAEFQVT